MAESLLEKVKAGIGLTGKYQDSMVQNMIDEIKQYLLDGGVKKEIAESPEAAGVIVKGVYDLYYNGALSAYFRERAMQLSYKKPEVKEDVQA